MAKSIETPPTTPVIDPAIIVQPAAPAERPQITRVLAEAFAEDEHTVGLLPRSNRPERLMALFGIIVAEAFTTGGHVWIVKKTGTEAVLGAAVWQAPGARGRSLSRIATVPSYLNVFGHRIVDAARTDHTTSQHRPQVPHWYLKAIGTSPQARGKGIASALLRHRLTIVDSSSQDTYLEASSRGNAEIYRRYGFTKLTDISAHGTIPTIGMWRAHQTPNNQ